jgi:hypothetical protein
MQSHEAYQALPAKVAQRVFKGLVNNWKSSKEAQTGEHLVFYPDLPLYAIAWSPDDTRFASAIGVSDVQSMLVP